MIAKAVEMSHTSTGLDVSWKSGQTPGQCLDTEGFTTCIPDHYDCARWSFLNPNLRRLIHRDVIPGRGSHTCLVAKIPTLSDGLCLSPQPQSRQHVPEDEHNVSMPMSPWRPAMACRSCKGWLWLAIATAKRGGIDEKLPG
jgi:hypothetical protein